MPLLTAITCAASWRRANERSSSATRSPAARFPDLSTPRTAASSSAPTTPLARAMRRPGWGGRWAGVIVPNDKKSGREALGRHRACAAPSLNLKVARVRESP